MTIDIQSKPKPKKTMRLAIEMLLGGAFGLSGMMMIDQYVALKSLSGWQLTAIALAAMIGMVMAIVFVTLASRRLMEIRMFDGEADAEEIAMQRRLTGYSVLSMMGLIPPLIILAQPQIIDPVLGLIVVIVSLFISSWFGWLSWKWQDELYRKAAMEGANLGLSIIFVGAIIWAALDLLGFGFAMEPLAVVVAILMITIMSSLIMAGRHAMFRS